MTGLKYVCCTVVTRSLTVVTTSLIRLVVVVTRIREFVVVTVLVAVDLLTSFLRTVVADKIVSVLVKYLKEGITSTETVRTVVGTVTSCVYGFFVFRDTTVSVVTDVTVTFVGFNFVRVSVIIRVLTTVSSSVVGIKTVKFSVAVTDNVVVLVYRFNFCCVEVVVSVWTPVMDTVFVRYFVAVFKDT